MSTFLSTATRALASTSRLPFSSSASCRAAAPASASRAFSSAQRTLAASTSGRPKREETPYGIPSSIPKADWPVQQETDTTGHPLWSFFHGQESLEAPDKRIDNTGRSWSSFELRRKSFDELHQLWYVLLKERNVLLTQREEARRLRVDLRGFTSHADKLRMIQKSMARTKQVLSERRHAALEAAAILRARGEDEKADRMANEGAAFAGELGL
ncbi:hypothetical protein RQP46_002749 [Phenoliferia psychrophenolica]